MCVFSSIVGSSRNHCIEAISLVAIAEGSSFSYASDGRNGKFHWRRGYVVSGHLQLLLVGADLPDMSN